MSPALELKEANKKIEVLEKRLALYEKDAAFSGFYTLNKIANQQIAYLQNFDITAKIASDDKGDQNAYKNAKDIWENLPDMISKLNKLRIELKVGDDEEEEKKIPVSAKSIASGEADV